MARRGQARLERLTPTGRRPSPPAMQMIRPTGVVGEFHIPALGRTVQLVEWREQDFYDGPVELAARWFDWWEATMSNPYSRRKLLEQEQASHMFVHQFLLSGTVVGGKKLSREDFGALLDGIEQRMVEIDAELEALGCDGAGKPLDTNSVK